MAEAVEHDIGEIWATVQGHGAAIANLGKQVDNGFKQLAETLATTHEKTDRRISDLTRETDSRIQSVAADYRKTASERQTSLLTTIGILLTAMIGLGGAFTGIVTVGATIYTFTKQPIDQSFGSLNGAVSQLTSDLKQEKEQRASDVKTAANELDQKFSNYVPKDEVRTNIEIFKAVTEKNTKRLDDVEKGIVIGVTDRVGIRDDVKRLDADIHELRNTVKQDFATRKETDVQFADQQARINSIVAGLNELRKIVSDGNSIGDRFKELSMELNGLKDKFIASPSYEAPPAKN